LEKIRKALSTPRTRQELIKLTGIPDRTLRYNLSILRERKMVLEYKNLNDMRKKMYLQLYNGGSR